jgi:hypothetical protein
MRERWGIEMERSRKRGIEKRTCALNGTLCMSLICLRIVLFPLSPEPRRRTYTPTAHTTISSSVHPYIHGE